MFIITNCYTYKLLCYHTYFHLVRVAQYLLIATLLLYTRLIQQSKHISINKPPIHNMNIYSKTVHIC